MTVIIFITPSGVRKQTLQPDQFKKIKINRSINSGVGSAALSYAWEEMEYTEISKNLKCIQLICIKNI